MSPRRKTGIVEYFDDLDVEEPHEPLLVRTPEPLKKVKVLHPFSVAYQGVPYWGDSQVEVPESLAHDWIRNQWVVAE